MSKATELARVTAELALVRTAIDATLEDNVSSYSTEIQTVARLGIDKLWKREKYLLSKSARLTRGKRFGRLGFTRITAGDDE